MVLPFTKLQGAGNDFVLLDLAEHAPPPGLPWDSAAVRLCDRRFGVGADGVLIRLPSEVADFRMRVLNADGSEPETCGNGLRCFARYLHDRGEVGDAPFTIETLAGIATPRVLLDAEGRFAGVRVGMGRPRELGDATLDVDGEAFAATTVSMGNPHAVIGVSELSEVAFDSLGPRLSTHPTFPEGANVEFVQVVERNCLRVKVWERGSGATLACGSGACAALVAMARKGLANRQANVELPGGTLLVEWGEDGEIALTGPAEIVFSGSVPL